MASWVYIFSKFTPEALLFESFFICFLCLGYTAYWILKKRKFGVLGQETPEYAVKSYLNQLIGDAEQMRIQLFGLLAGTGVDPALVTSLRASHASAGAAHSATAMLSALGGAGGAADPELGAKLVAIEAKMAEQAKAMDSITHEKTRLEKELIEVRSGKGGTPATESGADPKLAEKIKNLEAKLAEYSVIEDDLANLKRLQQENAQLKAQLGGKAPAAGASAPAGAAPSATPAAAASAATGANAAGEAPASAAAETSAAAGAAPETQQAEADAVAATSAALSEAAVDPIAAPTADAAFEGLVDQVEESLAEKPTVAAPAAATTAAAGASVADTAAPAVEAAAGTVTEAVAGATPPSPEKSDADLVAEFEKMLNS